MTTLATARPTMLDVAKATDPSGNIARIVELLNQTNEILEDAGGVMEEGNLPTGHRSSARTGLPTPTWRKLYGGVQPDHSTYVQVTDTTGMLEAYAEIDKKLADLNGNKASFRLTEDAGHIESMGQEVARVLIYGNESTQPEAFTGLTPRFNSLSAQNSTNIVNAGGVGADNTSIWLVVWGPNTVFPIHPKGIPTGIQFEDKGQVTIENIDGNGGRMEAYRSHYSWDLGLVVRDWRYVVRICNIDVSDLNTLSNTALLINYMIQAEERIPSLSRGRAVWYCNRRIREALRMGVLQKITYNLTSENVAGKMVTMFDGIPVRRVDQILNTEALVT